MEELEIYLHMNSIYGIDISPSLYKQKRKTEMKGKRLLSRDFWGSNHDLCLWFRLWRGDVRHELPRIHLGELKNGDALVRQIRWLGGPWYTRVVQRDCIQHGGGGQCWWRLRISSCQWYTRDTNLGYSILLIEFWLLKCNREQSKKRYNVDLLDMTDARVNRSVEHQVRSQP